MNLSKFDRILWRFNGVVIALGCLFAIGSVAFALVGLLKLLDVGPGSSGYPTEKKDVKPREVLRLSYFRRVQGTDLLVASLTTESNQTYSAFSSPSPSSASGTHNELYGARNFLFFNARSGNSRWLAPDNSTRYLSEHELVDEPAAESGKQRTTGYLYEAVPDQLPERRMEESPRSVVYYNLSSSAGKTILKGVERLQAVEQVSRDEAIIMYAMEGKNYAVSIKPQSGDEIVKRDLPAAPGVP